MKVSYVGVSTSYGGLESCLAEVRGINFARGTHPALACNFGKRLALACALLSVRARSVPGPSLAAAWFSREPANGCCVGPTTPLFSVVWESLAECSTELRSGSRHWWLRIGFKDMATPHNGHKAGGQAKSRTRRNSTSTTSPVPIATTRLSRQLSRCRRMAAST